MAVVADTYAQRLTTGIVVTCLTLSVLSFGLRIYARKVSAAKLWWDDYWMTIPMVICIAMSTCDFIGVVHGSGQHQAELDEQTVLTFMKVRGAFASFHTKREVKFADDAEPLLLHDILVYGRL